EITVADRRPRHHGVCGVKQFVTQQHSHYQPYRGPASPPTASIPPRRTGTEIHNTAGLPAARVPGMPVAINALSFVRRSIAVAAAALTIAAASACDEHSPSQPGANPRQVTVLGTGQ